MLSACMGHAHQNVIIVSLARKSFTQESASLDLHHLWQGKLTSSYETLALYICCGTLNPVHQTACWLR